MAGPRVKLDRRDRVLELSGMPRVVSKGVDSWGVELRIQVGYDREGGVDGVGLGPGNDELKLDGQLVWAFNEHPDSDPVLLALFCFSRKGQSNEASPDHRKDIHRGHEVAGLRGHVDGSGRRMCFAGGVQRGLSVIQGLFPWPILRLFCRL